MDNLIALSASAHFHDKENCAPLKPDKNGELSNLWAFGAFDNVRWSAEQIVRHLTFGRAICVAETTTNWRKGENFKSAQIMGVDFDNGPGVIQLLDEPLIDNYAFLVYATASSADDAPRSRALFILDNPITDPLVYRRLLRRLMLSFNRQDVDAATKDDVRIFYGSAGRKYSDVISALLPLAVLEALPIHPSEAPVTFAAPPMLTVQSEDHLGKYVQTAVDGELNQLAHAREHRNNALVTAAFNLGTLAAAPWSHLTRFEVEQALYTTAHANGYVAKDGEGAAKATIRSGFEGGLKQPRPMPANDEIKRGYVAPVQPPPQPSLPVAWHTSAESMVRYRERLQTARKDGRLPLPFPFRALHSFGGFCRIVSPGFLIGVVGLSGGMKTSFVETITDTWRQMGDNDVLWYGPEWNWEKMGDRAVQRWGGANLTDVMLHELYLIEQQMGLTKHQGKLLSKDAYDRSVEASEKIEHWPGRNHYIERMDIDIDELLIASAERLAEAKAQNRNIRIAVFDYLQLIDMRSARSEQERITNILGRIKAFCVDNALIGIVASQVTKSASAENKENNKLLTGEAGQYFRGDKFNLVLTLNPIYDGKLLTDQGYINVDKNSAGSTGAVQVFIDPSRFRWIDTKESES